MSPEQRIFEFFEFTEKNILELSYLIELGDRLNIKDAFMSQLYNFDKKDNETFPIFYKRMFLGELTWRLDELVCAEYYPNIAISHLEDFGLFFQDIWLDNENDNVFLTFFLENDLSKLTSREMVELKYTQLKETYQLYPKLM